MMESSDRPAAEIAMELGIRRNQLYKWKEQMENNGDKAFSGRGGPRKEDQSEVTTLRQENERLREENEILKKAAAYFAKELKLSTHLSEHTANSTRYLIFARH